MSAICKAEKCTRLSHYKATGLCQMHNYRMRKHGSTDKPVRDVIPAAEQIRRALAAGMAEAEEVGDCLEWQGKFACKGVTPVVPFYANDKKRTENAPVPRLLWEAEHGSVPDGKLVYRKCCNNACVLQEHLAAGSRADWAKARKRAGTTKHGAATLIALTLAARRRADVVNTMEKARQVRSLTAGRVPMAEIVEQTGVSRAMVLEMRQGTAWRELGGNLWAGL